VFSSLRLIVNIQSTNEERTAQMGPTTSFLSFSMQMQIRVHRIGDGRPRWGLRVAGTRNLNFKFELFEFELLPRSVRRFQ
jgi:hypothetical protein